MKLLEYLLVTGLAADERTANGLIMAGRVLVNEKPQTSSHAEVAQGASVRIKGDTSGAVSRGLAKILPALASSGFDVTGRICLDLGISTGGFTQALLNAGALKVYAVDVAYGITALEIRNDPRVRLIERTNVRDLNPEAIPEKIDRVVGDLSFISWQSALPPVIPLLADAAELLLLAKPQFEMAAAGRGGELETGVASLQQTTEVVKSLGQLWQSLSLQPLDVIPSGLKGPSGNRELFIYLRRITEKVSLAEYGASVERAVKETP